MPYGGKAGESPGDASVRQTGSGLFGGSGDAGGGVVGGTGGDRGRGKAEGGGGVGLASRCLDLPSGLLFISVCTAYGTERENKDNNSQFTPALPP